MNNNFTEVYIALGYFDSVHLGHKAIIQETCELAKKNNAKSVVFTFKKNLDEYFGKYEGDVFTLSERKQIYTSLGIDEVYVYPVSKTSLEKGKKSFLNYINKKYKIKGYVCGEDYSFGKNAFGNIEYLKKYASKNLQSVNIIKILTKNNEKISTTNIKNLLKNGNIEAVNLFLGDSYFLKGKVVRGRKVGRKLGFPTANIQIDNNKFKIKSGVYYGHIIYDNKTYKTIINYGTQPTFNLQKIILETYIKDFSKNIYGEEITLYFDGFLREIKKFDTVDELKTQLQNDIKVLI